LCAKRKKQELAAILGVASQKAKLAAIMFFCNDACKLGYRSAGTSGELSTSIYVDEKK